ncbi:TlpA family protein disulfide reductase [Penaeicola halotolerans]|uniref:TlpA family protein disulfide reductase n=1 Tax=Penaeicola halotolerans TaxID=2793196 RepID=UPI001CF91452|nr:TlpA disulfide reductase family protein [Penaeicola halotolerans]
MTVKKRLLRFLKRYFIGLAVLYVGVLASGYYLWAKMDAHVLNAQKPSFAISNHLGGRDKITDFEGKYVLVDFWFAGCKPCIKEMQYFPQLLDKYGDELVIMSISVDPPELFDHVLNSPDRPFDFIETNRDNWRFYRDSKLTESYAKAYEVSAYPTYLLYDPSGELVAIPMSGVLAVESKLGGIFDLGLSLQLFKDILVKLPMVLVPYTMLVLLILGIQLIIFLIRKYIFNSSTTLVSTTKS